MTMPDVRRTRLVLAGVATAVLAADQLTKSVAVYLVDDRTVDWGPISLSATRNTGGPFGVGSSWPAVWLLFAVAGAAVAVWAFVRVDRLDGVTVAGAIVVGGVYGNLLDRVVRGRTGGATGVVDWITVEPYPYAFNLADVALRLGAVALIVAVWRQRPNTVTARSLPPEAESSITNLVGPHTATDPRGH
ncbi:MAG: signal peptidase II [Ilumatobacteraceae bacterium]